MEGCYGHLFFLSWRPLACTCGESSGIPQHSRTVMGVKSCALCLAMAGTCWRSTRTCLLHPLWAQSHGHFSSREVTHILPRSHFCSIRKVYKNILGRKRKRMTKATEKHDPVRPNCWKTSCVGGAGATVPTLTCKSRLKNSGTLYESEEPCLDHGFPKDEELS